MRPPPRDGRLACWGGAGRPDVSGPNASTDSYTAVSAGASTTCALRTDGLPKNRYGRALLGHLKVYAGSEHPHKAQTPVEA